VQPVRAAGGTLFPSRRISVAPFSLSAIEDVLRPETVEAVTRMRSVGMTIVLLTGGSQPHRGEASAAVGCPGFCRGAAP
jgi:cation transport ATPase